MCIRDRLKARLTAIANSSPPSSQPLRFRPVLKAIRYKGLCGTALCCIINPITGHYCKIRALIDSGANISLLDERVAKAVGLSGEKQSIVIGTASGKAEPKKEMEVVFQLATRNKAHVTAPVIALLSEAVGLPFPAIDLVPSKHEYLKGLTLAEEFPTPPSLPFQLLLGEPYVTFITQEPVRYPPTEELPIACKTELGWILKGAIGTSRYVEAQSSFSASSQEHESFDLETMRASIGFDFSKFWSCLLYTSPSPRDLSTSRMPSSA